MKILKGEYSFLILRFQIKCECFTHALLTIVLHSVSQSEYKFSYKCEVLLSALETVYGIPVHLFVFKITWNLSQIPTQQFEHC